MRPPPAPSRSWPTAGPSSAVWSRLADVGEPDRPPARRLAQHEPCGIDRGCGVGGAADVVGPDPATGDDDRAQPAVDLEQLHERRVARPRRPAAHVDRPGPVRCRSWRTTHEAVALEDRLLEPRPLALQHRSSARPRHEPRPAVRSFARSAARSPASSPVPGRPGRRAVPAPRPPPLAPPQLRPRAARWTAWRLREPSQLVALHAKPAPAARCCPSVARWSSRASSPRRQACQTPRTSSRPVRIERLGQPGGGAHQPGGVAAVAGRRSPEPRRPLLLPGIAAVRPASSHASGASSERASSRLSGELARPPSSSPPLGAGASPGRQHDQLGPGPRHLPPLPSEKVPRGRAAARAATASPRASSAKARYSSSSARFTDGRRSLSSSTAAAAAASSGRPAASNALHRSWPDLDRHLAPGRQGALCLRVQPQCGRQVTTAERDVPLVVDVLRGLEVLTLDLEDPVRLLQGPLGAHHVAHVEVHHGHRRERAGLPDPVAQGPRASQRASEVSQRLGDADPARRTARSHDASGTGRGPSGRRPPRPTGPAHEVPLWVRPPNARELPERRPHVRQAVGVTTAPRQVSAQPQLAQRLVGPALVAKDDAVRMARHRQHPRVGRRLNQFLGARRGLGRLGDREPQQLLGVGHVLDCWAPADPSPPAP